jgi:ABC-type phosphate/phosphonate transport system substrate-binding protein
MLREGKVQGAILPTPVVSQQMAQGGGITVVLTTEPIPHIGFSAAPTVDAGTRQRLAAMLIGADKTPEGQAMLKAIGFERFDPATPAVYDGQANILKEYWGF